MLYIECMAFIIQLAYQAAMLWTVYVTIVTNEKVQLVAVIDDDHRSV